MSMRKTGIYELLGDVTYFIPDDLPPKNPSLQLSLETLELYGQASYNLATLNEASSRLPDQNRFIKAYVIKEALLSSSIEGIHTTLIDVFNYTDREFSNINKNTQLVVNYTQALDIAMNMMKEEGLPICSRVILAAHYALLFCNENSSPGSYRKQTVKVGNLTPPMALKIPDLIANLERYINEDISLPSLIKAGLVHLQFETIHPFLDGNGRIGRLLIILMLVDSKLLDDPILYISYYFKKHHKQYYQALDDVRVTGNFEGWINFYLKAVAETAFDANLRIKNIEKLDIELQNKIRKEPQFLKKNDNALRVLNLLFSSPVITITFIAQNIDKTYHTTNKIITKFVEMGILSITAETKGKRYKEYKFDLYLKLLEKEY